MKSTKIMLAVIASFIVTWMSIGFLIYLFSDMTYKESCSNAGVGFTMLFIGWIPAFIIAYDLMNQIKNY